ncbi:hypothetical protein M513_11367 [Trichuris suis]|uniref:Uncharacterized protein n=1 Tax=Trichuris suis TaxID=68888 RepID=A0A085LS09_9BILA|nr:hypothetical protein M513_11367 [Trichuris suis]
MWLTCNNEDSKFQILYDDETVGSMPNAQREPDEEKNLFRKMKQRICAHGAKNHFNAQKLLYNTLAASCFLIVVSQGPIQMLEL